MHAVTAMPVVTPLTSSLSSGRATSSSGEGGGHSGTSSVSKGSFDAIDGSYSKSSLTCMGSIAGISEDTGTTGSINDPSASLRPKASSKRAMHSAL